MVTSEGKIRVPQFNSVKEYEEAYRQIKTELILLKRENEILRGEILQLHQAIAAINNEPTNSL
jgi:hypothetical protein